MSRDKCSIMHIFDLNRIIMIQFKIQEVKIIMIKDFDKEAKLFLKHILLEEEITYIELSNKLKDIGIDYSSDSLRMKINRGRFDFAFLLQVAEVLGYKIGAQKNL